MKKTCYGVILKVNNLALCKGFYKNILSLGDPAIDSNFMCEFHIENDFSLILEKAEWEFMPEAKESRSSWILHTEDMKVFLENMKKYGYEPESRASDKFGIMLLKCRDPEGNVFYITSKNEQ